MNNKKIPWNKGKKGLQVAWNKGLKGVCKPNSGSFKKGHKAPKTAFKKGSKINLGRKRLDMTNEKHSFWKGNKAKYGAIHAWINRKLGKPIKCEHCGKLKTTSRSMQWANKDHKYSRNFDDWFSLCVFCHRRYDYDNNLKPDNKIGNNQFKKC